MNTFVWIGKMLSVLVVIALAADAATCLAMPGVIAGEMAMTEFPANLAPILGVILLISTLLYAIPRTAVLGAVLVTAFLGGAICTHLRLGEIGSPPEIAALLLGLLSWGGLYLRDRRLRTLLPLVARHRSSPGIPQV